MTAPAARPAAPEISALITWMRHPPGTGPRRAGPAGIPALPRARHDLPARIKNPGRAPAAPQDQPGDLS